MHAFRIISFEAIPLGFCRFARAWPSAKSVNSSSVGTSFLGLGETVLHQMTFTVLCVSERGNAATIERLKTGHVR